MDTLPWQAWKGFYLKIDYTIEKTYPQIYQKEIKGTWIKQLIKQVTQHFYTSYPLIHRLLALIWG